MQNGKAPTLRRQKRLTKNKIAPSPLFKFARLSQERFWFSMLFRVRDAFNRALGL